MCVHLKSDFYGKPSKFKLIETSIYHDVLKFTITPRSTIYIAHKNIQIAYWIQCFICWKSGLVAGTFRCTDHSNRRHWTDAIVIKLRVKCQMCKKPIRYWGSHNAIYYATYQNTYVYNRTVYLKVWKLVMLLIWKKQNPSIIIT